MGAFRGIVEELAAETAGREPPPLFDAVLIDEAQDLPTAFFRLTWQVAKPPHRVVWAYDELQNLGDWVMVPPEELFGDNGHGQPLVTLRQVTGEAHQDVILPKCYRNTPWALVIAHGLGFGIYRDRGLIQIFDEPSLWRDIGYEVDGQWQPGNRVTLRRSAGSTPAFFNDLISPDDAFVTRVLTSAASQAEWVAGEIHRNLNEDELDPDDILVILPNPLDVPGRAAGVIGELRRRGIAAHIAGVTSSRDMFRQEDSVTISGIFRAKGNEAPMVYVLDADFCQGGTELIRKRNILFTGITRSRAWVRVTGVGSSMEALQTEIDEVRRHGYGLEFVVPTPAELERLRRIHREMTRDELREILDASGSLRDLVTKLEAGTLEVSHLPKDLRERLAGYLGIGSSEDE